MFSLFFICDVSWPCDSVLYQFKNVDCLSGGVLMTVFDIVMLKSPAGETL